MIAYGGILTGLVLVATMFLQLPNGQGGYVNLGDGVIFASSLILGPFAGVVAGLGSVLSDLFLGYVQYAPATLVIKGVMGLVAGIMLRKEKERESGYFFTAFVFLICECIMIGGYFSFESVLFGIPYALVNVIPNVIQGVAGVAVGLASIPIVNKILNSEKFSV